MLLLHTSRTAYFSPVSDGSEVKTIEGEREQWCSYVLETFAMVSRRRDFYACGVGEGSETDWRLRWLNVM